MFVFLMISISYFTYISFKTFNMETKEDFSNIFIVQGFCFLFAVVILCEFSFPNPLIPEAIVYYCYLQGPALFFLNIFLSFIKVNRNLKVD